MQSQEFVLNSRALVEGGISGFAEELTQAILSARGMPTKLGEIALRKGLLKMDQLSEILTAQEHSSQRIGEVAVALGYLTRDQVRELLVIQKQEQVAILRAVADELHRIARERLAALRI